MTVIIFFIVGLLLGSCIGITTMCCLQINRLYKIDSTRKPTNKKSSPKTELDEKILKVAKERKKSKTKRPPKTAGKKCGSTVTAVSQG